MSAVERAIHQAVEVADKEQDLPTKSILLLLSGTMCINRQREMALFLKPFAETELSAIQLARNYDN